MTLVTFWIYSVFEWQADICESWYSFSVFSTTFLLLAYWN